VRRAERARAVVREVLAQVPPPRPQAAPRPARRRRAPHQKATFELPRPLLEAFRAACAAQGVTQRGAVEVLVRTYVAQAATDA